MPSSSSSKPPEPPKLRAVYRSSNGTKEFKHSIDGATTASSENFTTKEKTAYLSALRSSVTALQGEVNVYLTLKMEEDKAAAGNGASRLGGGNEVVDETIEEQFYGEELGEDGG